MEGWSTVEKIATGGVAALALALVGLHKIWGRYVLVSDRELKFKDEKLELILTALNNNTLALNRLADKLEGK